MVSVLDSHKNAYFCGVVDCIGKVKKQGRGSRYRPQIGKIASYQHHKCKRVRDATLLSIFQFFTFAARI